MKSLVRNSSTGQFVPQSDSLENAFWSVATTGDKNCCWEWLARLRTNKGYGRVFYDGKYHASHRLSYKLLVGELSDQELVCHSCDNPPCWNPDHLFKGSHADNHADRNQKGRQAHGSTHGWYTKPEKMARGHRQWKSSLTESQVEEIMRLSYDEGLSSRKIAQKLFVSRSPVQHVLKGRTWNHITGLERI